MGPTRQERAPSLTPCWRWLTCANFKYLRMNPLAPSTIGYLFSSSGYFVSAGIHELTSLSSNANDEMWPNAMGAARKFLVSLELGDSTGRRFNFDEVGSGLGYVLPVLLAVATSRTCFLQQPPKPGKHLQTNCAAHGTIEGIVHFDAAIPHC